LASLGPSIRRWLHSLQAQLILWAILPVTLVIIGLALTGVYTHEAAMHDFVVERDGVLARLLARQLEDALAEGRLAPTPEGVAAWLAARVDAITPALLVIDGVGDVLAGSEPQPPASVRDEPGIDQVLEGVSGGFTVDTPSGLLVLTYAAVQGTDWRVVVREPATDVTGPILRLSGLGPVAAVVAAALSILILAFGWRTIVHPLQRLANAAGQVTWGAYAAIRRPVSGVAEIEELHRALLDMVTRLEGYQAGVLDYLDAVTQGQEEERARLARELHDGPVQALIALGQRVEMAQHRIERNDAAAARELLEAARASAVDVVDDLRRIIGALRPAYLEDLGFAPALEMLLHGAAVHAMAEIRLDVAPDLPRLSPAVELAAYRIVQEALNNALQHAGASIISVTVACAGDELHLSVGDDGAGFEPVERLDLYTRQGHFGLVGLHERVRQLGGRLRLDAAPGQGTTLHAWLPTGATEASCQAPR